jgi:hypothetical protein
MVRGQSKYVFLSSALLILHRIRIGVLNPMILLQFNVLVTYTYRADDGVDELGSRDRKAIPTTKSFSFYVCIDLGTITPS